MFTNKSNIPLSLAVWLAADDYDHSDDPNTISATSLLKPIRSIVLARQNKDLLKVADLDSMIPSRMGTALHTAIEQSWDSGSLYEILESLNYPEEVIKNIIINPKAEDITDKSICIYMEQRAHKKVGKYRISGKYDFVSDGTLEDFKSTGVYNYISGSNTKKYGQQGSIYKWLNPDIITSDHMKIQFIFTDWSKIQAMKDPKYPQVRLKEQKIPLMSQTETQLFVEDILNRIEKYEESPQEDLPQCTSEELWRKPDVFKYYKDPTKKTRSTKNFDNIIEAMNFKSSKQGAGVIDTFPGQVVRCRYCDVVGICDQAAAYHKAGLLIL